MGLSELITVELAFIKQCGNHVVAEDIEGKERWFDIRKVECEIIGEDVVVTLNKFEWYRRVNNKEVQPRKERRVLRKCICCRTEASMEPQNRICDPCKNTSEWRGGRSPYAI